MIPFVVVAVTLNLMILSFQPTRRNIVELIISFVDQLILVFDAAFLETAEVQVLVRRVVIRDVAELMETMLPEYALRILAPCTSLANRNYLTDIVL